MRRHQRLAPLSRQHHQALVEGRALSAVGLDADEAGRRAAATRFLAFFDAEGQRHFRAEEDVLLPAYSPHGPLDVPGIVRMLLDHAAIRGLARLCREALEAGAAPDAALLRDLGARLTAHVRLEEDEVFPLIERAMPEEALARLEGL